MNAQAGYSGTPLPRKLGLKDGQRVAFVDLPASLGDLAHAAGFSSLESVADWRGIAGRHLDVIHMFTAEAAHLDTALTDFRGRIDPDGMIWISWPKKASKVPTDITEDVIRDRALSDIFVDVKVCAVDHIWSGLKLVVRKENRAALAAEQRG